MFILFAMSLAILMVGIDATAVNIALVSIQRETGAALPQLQWILNGYLLALAGFMVVGGRIGDTFGRKRIFYLGVFIFALSSALGGFAPSVGWIIASRVLQGIGGAMLWPATMAIAYGGVSPNKRGSAIGMLTGVGGLAMAVGPLVGGYLVQELSWRGIFWLNVPLGLIVAVATYWAAREKDVCQPESIDYAGSLLFSLSLFALIYAIQKANTWGWGSADFIDMLVLAMIGFGFFIYREKHAQFPLIDLSLLGNTPFMGALAARFLTSCTWIVVLFVMALYFQHVLGWSALKSGLAFLPLTLSFGAMSAFGGRLIDRIGFQKPTLFGLLLASVGFCILGRIQLTSSLNFFVLPFFLMGLGQGISTTGLGTGALSTVPKEKTGFASGVMTMVGLAGGSISLAFVGLLLGYFGDLRLISKLRAIHIVPDVIQASVLKGFLTSKETSHQLLDAFSPATRNVVLGTTDAVYTHMLGIAMLICAGLTVVSFVLVFFSLKTNSKSAT